VEVTSAIELRRALQAGARVVELTTGTYGIFRQTSTVTAAGLGDPPDITAVSESGIQDAGQIEQLRNAGYRDFWSGSSDAPGSSRRSSRRLMRSGAAQVRPDAYKICGITRSEDVLLCARLGVHAIGFNFFPGSRRYVTPEAARKVAQDSAPFL